MDGSSRSTHSALTELTELMGVSTGVAGVLDAADLHLGPGLVAGFATIGSGEAVPVRWLADVEPFSDTHQGRVVVISPAITPWHPAKR